MRLVIDCLKKSNWPGASDSTIQRVAAVAESLPNAPEQPEEFVGLPSSIYWRQQRAHKEYARKIKSMTVIGNPEFSGGIPVEPMTLVHKNGSSYQCYPLHYAVRTCDPKMLGELLSSGLDPNMTDREGRTALLESCIFGHTEMTTLLLQHGAHANTSDHIKIAPIHMLIFFEEKDILNVASQLVRSGAEVNVAMRSDTGNVLADHGILLVGSPLHFAVSCRNLVAIKTLLDFGADPNILVLFQRPLDLAASMHFSDVCRLLISHGAKTEAYWATGRSPMHWIGDASRVRALGKVRVFHIVSS